MNGFGLKQKMASQAPEINMAPLIDMIFILLIFFLVTTSFVKEAGVEVQRPSAVTATAKEKADMFIGLTADGQVYMEGKRVDLRMVRPRLERHLIENPDSSVVIVADRASQTDAVIRVMDECRLAGVAQVSLAAESEAQGMEAGR